MKNFKKFTLGLLCSALIPSLAMSQSEPSKPTFEKRVYLNNGNTYVQKAMPLYLKFSTEPDGKNYDLKSKSTPKYADPMYLDTEGINYIRSKWAVDPETKRTVQPQQEVMYEVYADGIAPYTSISFSGAPRYYGGGVQYYGKGLQVTLSSKDGVSGVEKTHFSLNGAAYKAYSSTLTFTSDKANVLYYFANDNVGNAEQSRVKKFTVDLTAPSTSDEIVGIVHQGNIIAPSTKFKLTSSDASSGVRRTLYSYDDRSENVYPGYPVSVAYLSDGQHTLYYHSVDRVKNDESRKSFSFYLDKIPPVVTVTIQGDQYETSGRMYVSSRTKVNMTATDNKAGVESITYNIDGKGNVTFSSPFLVPEKGGLHSIRYYSTDNVKNRTAGRTVASAIGNKRIYMDNRPPTTGIRYGSPQFFDRDTLFINSKTKLTLTSQDYESGVANIKYKVDGGSENTYQSPFNISKEGYHTVNFKATDRVNNVEQEKTSNAFVDNTPPVIHHNFSIEPIGTKNKQGKTVKIYPNYTRLYLGATDKHCGTQRITYSLDGQTFQDYSSPYTLDVSEVKRFRKNKFYEVTVRAYDKLGNQSEKKITFFVGE